MKFELLSNSVMLQYRMVYCSPTCNHKITDLQQMVLENHCWALLSVQYTLWQPYKVYMQNDRFICGDVGVHFHLELRLLVISITLCDHYDYLRQHASKRYFQGTKEMPIIMHKSYRFVPHSWYWRHPTCRVSPHCDRDPSVSLITGISTIADHSSVTTGSCCNKKLLL